MNLYEYVENDAINYVDPFGYEGSQSQPNPTFLPIKAVSGPNNSVIYFYPDGRTETWSGGTRAWRNCNPGNIRGGDSKIGSAGGFAVFPNYDAGRLALRNLLQGDKYRNLTVGNFLYTYAPTTENNTDAYRDYLTHKTGLDGNRTIGSLSGEELNLVLDAIQSYEGYKAGQIATTTSPPSATNSAPKLPTNSIPTRPTNAAPIRPTNAISG